MEFTIRKASGHLNIPLQDLPLKSGILIACILRNGRPLIPTGQSWLQLNDHVIVVTTNSNYDDLEDCFD
ncbi:MAG: TrkA C-terminal domain-containing protein [Holdemania massiliensis]